MKILIVGSGSIDPKLHYTKSIVDEAPILLTDKQGIKMEFKPMELEVIERYSREYEMINPYRNLLDGIENFYENNTKTGTRKDLTPKQKVKRKVKSKLSRKSRKANLKK